MLEQTKREKKRDRHRSDSGREPLGELFSERVTVRSFHRVLEEKLSGDKRGKRDKDQNEFPDVHNFSSILAKGLATTTRPIITSAIPHQRRVEINSPRKIQQLNGT